MRSVFSIILSFSVACAAPWQQQAARYGSVSKEIVDVGATAVSRHVQDMARKCEVQVSLEDYAACLGPVAGNPDDVMATFESVRAAQLSLYIAIASDDHAAAMVALAELKQRLKKAADLVKAAKGTK